MSSRQPVVSGAELIRALGVTAGASFVSAAATSG
jgi:hypothetical protein